MWRRGSSQFGNQGIEEGAEAVEEGAAGQEHDGGGGEDDPPAEEEAGTGGDDCADAHKRGPRRYDSSDGSEEKGRGQTAR